LIEKIVNYNVKSVSSLLKKFPIKPKILMNFLQKSIRNLKLIKKNKFFTFLKNIVWTLMNLLVFNLGGAKKAGYSTYFNYPKLPKGYKDDKRLWKSGSDMHREAEKRMEDLYKLSQGLVAFVNGPSKEYVPLLREFIRNAKKSTNNYKLIIGPRISIAKSLYGKDSKAMSMPFFGFNSLGRDIQPSLDFLKSLEKILEGH